MLCRVARVELGVTTVAVGVVVPRLRPSAVTVAGVPPMVTGLVLVGVNCKIVRRRCIAAVISVNAESAEVSSALVEIWPAPVPNVSVCAVFDPTWTVSVLPEPSPANVAL